MKTEVRKVLIGQDQMLSRLLIALLTGGHVLLEGRARPGEDHRHQGAGGGGPLQVQPHPVHARPAAGRPDRHADLQSREGAFSTRKGPIFANLILADEINRAPSKVQSALLEAMQEHQVTIGDETFTLDEPFLVLATQNPIEQEGTYPLPEAQVDRFMLKVVVDYPSTSDERKVVDVALDGLRREVQPVLDPVQLAEMKQTAASIYLDDKVKDYVLDIVSATRHPEKYKLSDLKPLIEYGASPRASINLCLAARAHAFLVGRAYVTPQDVKDVALDILRHRVLLTYEAEAEETTSDDVIRKVLESVPVP